jgi:hypothetical protein
VEPDVASDRPDCDAPAPGQGDPHHVITELAGVRLRHNDILPGPPHGKPDHVSPIRAADPPIETALPYQQQRAIALDYTANIAMVVRMLGQKWNQLANAGMFVNGLIGLVVGVEARR